MNERPAGQPETPNGSEADRLLQLRRLLGNPEQQRQIAQLQEQLESERVNAERVSKVLPDAIRRSAAQDERFARALGPTLSEAFKASIKRDPQGLVDTIAPIMGPAIRRSIVQTIRAMVQSLNTTLEHSMTPQGLKWRIEAWRTGKSFGEVLMLHTLVYRIEQLLLIDTETGLLLCHVSAEPVEDADVVSSMLTAIQDFVHDSFRNPEDVRTMDCGDLTVWIEQGPRARLAAAVRGEPPISLREKLQAALETIHIEQAQELASFDGDNQPFEQSRIHLERCLEYEYVSDDAKSKRSPMARVLWLVPIVLLLAAIVWGLLAWNHTRRQHQLAQLLELPTEVQLTFRDGVLRLSGAARHTWIEQAKQRIERLSLDKEPDLAQLEDLDAEWIEFVQLLRDEPGIIVTSTRQVGESYELYGLRDPLARDPESLRQMADLKAELLLQHWQPYQSQEDSFVLARAGQQLQPPGDVLFDLSDGRLVLAGTASEEWIQRAHIIAPIVAGVREVDTSKLRSDNAGKEYLHAWKDYLTRLGQEPGITVMSDRTEGDRFIVHGLRDPLAADPRALIDPELLDPARVVGHWGRHESLDPEIILHRARLLLQPPPEVDIELQEDILFISGVAAHDWVQGVQGLTGLAGIRQIDTSRLRDAGIEQLDTLQRWVARQVVHCQPRSAKLGDGQIEWVRVLAKEIEKLNAAAKSVGRSVRIEIVGANLGSNLGQSLGRARAESVRDAMIQAGIPIDLLATRTAAIAKPSADKSEREESPHQVTFQIIVSPTSD